MKTEENQDVQDVSECIWRLSGSLMSGTLKPDEELHAIEIIDTLATMLARWYHIR